MLGFEFTVLGILHTFLLLLVNATEVERREQQSTRKQPSEKPGEEFEHGLQPHRILSPAKLSSGQTMLLAKGFVFETLHDNTCPLSLWLGGWGLGKALGGDLGCISGSILVVMLTRSKDAIMMNRISKFVL